MPSSSIHWTMFRRMTIMAHRSSHKRPFSAPALNRPGKLQKTAPPLQGPLHDARYIQAQHDTARPPPKPSLLDNPKSPVANLAAALAIPLNYHFTDLFDPTANRRIVRSVSLFSVSPPLTLSTAAPSSSIQSPKSPP